MGDNVKTKSAYVVLVNYDLTEGRGREYVKYVCDLEATAIRLATGAGVQGSDARVMPVTLQEKNNVWYGPVRIEQATDADEKNQLIIDDRRAVEEKARALGLTDDDLYKLKRK